MSRRFSFFALLLTVVLLPVAAGCGPKRPPVVEAHGVVLLNQKPLPNAAVQFVPLLDAFASEMGSTATTDDQGRFTLKCAWKDQNGAVVATHRVLVYEAGPPPDPNAPVGDREARHPDNSAAQARLPNRPIPPKYGNLGETPINIEVKEGQSEYKIELTR